MPSSAVIIAAQTAIADAGTPEQQGSLARQASQATMKALSGGKSGMEARKASQAQMSQATKAAATGDDNAEADEGAKNFMITEHCLDLEDVEKLYSTDKTCGISDPAVVEQSRNEFGKNELTPPYQTPVWLKFILHQVGGFSLLLWGGSALCFIVYGLDGSMDNLYLGIVLAVVVFLTGIFAFYQEYKAEEAMESFKNLTPDKCCCIRGYNQTGEGGPASSDKAPLVWNGFDAAQLVRGDLVEVSIGQKVPADIYIISQEDMKVDNAALTGEAEPLSRSDKKTHDAPHETKNLAFYGTFCVQGTCKAFVVRTGDQTMVGQISKETQGNEKRSTMEEEIEHFIHIVSGVAAVIGITFFILALVMKYSFVKALIFMIGIIVANVPEGLLATVTVALTLTATKMKDKNVLVKSAKTIETLGSITTIASDKTGTLTQNRMTATHAINAMKIVALDEGIMGESESATKDVAAGQGFDMTDPDFARLQRISAVCGKAYFHTATTDDKGVEHIHYDKETGQWAKKVLDRAADGDASETALLKFNEPVAHEWYKSNTDNAKSYAEQYVVQYRKAYEKVGQVPFNSTNKWMMTMHEANPGCEPADGPFAGEKTRMARPCTISS
jgi:sodium/potassium-transporting ATPase subunit alpha